MSSVSARAWRGEVWLVNLDPTKGREQAKQRPAVVLSNNKVNGSAGVVVVIPLTTTHRPGIPLHVKIEPPEGGLPKVSYTLPEQIRSISTLRLIKRFGMVSSPKKMTEIEDSVRIILDL